MKFSVLELAYDIAAYAECLPYEDFPEAYDEALYSQPARYYFDATYRERCTNLSFAVELNNRPAALVDCVLMDGLLRQYDFPARILVSRTLSVEYQSLVVSEVFRQFDAIASAHDIAAIEIEELTKTAHASPIALQCLARRSACRPGYSAIVDLTQSANDIRAGVRKSYKSLLNWGKRELCVKHVNAEIPDRQLFETYKELHLSVAGRVTRSEQSWNAQFENAVSGYGEILLGFLGDRPVAGMVVTDGMARSYYASGAYVRELFDKPLGHWLLFQAILSAKSRNRLTFEIGEILLGPDADPKIAQISMFKKGFTKNLEQRIIWRVPGAQAS